MKKKTMAMLISLVFILVCAVGGTLAWLTAQTGTITNTFTGSDIGVELAESTGTSYQMVPGHTISKDPKVTITAGSEDCYLFVKVEKSSNFDDFMTYEMAKDANEKAIWTQLEGVDGVYYMIFDSKGDNNMNAKGTAYSVLDDNKVTVKDTVTKTMMDGLNAEGATKPTLTFTAYASQLYKNNTEKFTPAEAWANAKPAEQNN